MPVYKIMATPCYYNVGLDTVIINDVVNDI